MIGDGHQSIQDVETRAINPSYLDCHDGTENHLDHESHVDGPLSFHTLEVKNLHPCNEWPFWDLVGSPIFVLAS